MNACAEDAWKKADAELNAVYKKLQSRNKEDARASELLTAAERAWLAFRDAECDYGAAGNQGGSIFPLVYFGCLDKLTKTSRLVRLLLSSLIRGIPFGATSTRSRGLIWPRDRRHLQNRLKLRRPIVM